MIIGNGESHLTRLGTERLDPYRPERERICPLLLEDARRGLEDIAAGRVQDADAAIAGLQQRRAERARKP